MSQPLEFADWLNVVSLYLGLRNLEENEQQSAQTLKILRQNDVGAANDRQAAYMLAELDRKFDEQNKILAVNCKFQILKTLSAQWVFRLL